MFTFRLFIINSTFCTRFVPILNSFLRIYWNLHSDVYFLPCKFRRPTSDCKVAIFYHAYVTFSNIAWSTYLKMLFHVFLYIWKFIFIKMTSAGVNYCSVTLLTNTVCIHKLFLIVVQISDQHYAKILLVAFFFPKNFKCVDSYYNMKIM